MDALCLYNLMQTRVAIFYFLNISCVKCNLRKLVAQNATPRPSVRIELLRPRDCSACASCGKFDCHQRSCMELKDDGQTWQRLAALGRNRKRPNLTELGRNKGQTWQRYDSLYICHINCCQV